VSEVRPEVASKSSRKKWLYATFLLIIPGVLWTAAVVVPFLPLATGAKVWLAGGFAVAAEVVFWVSAVFIGKEVAKRYREHLDPRTWFRRKRS